MIYIQNVINLIPSLIRLFAFAALHAKCGYIFFSK